MTDPVTAKGSRSVVISGNFAGNIITGDHNKVFTESGYEKLSEAYIYPGEIFEQVNLDRFVGRGWLLDIIDSFIRDHDRGYIILEANAGMGKTAFMAWLTKTRNYPHAFFGLNHNEESQLRNLDSQIILNYDLGEKEILTPSASRYDYFYGLLEKAAEKLTNDKKIVIIIDGVDEILDLDPKISKNIFGLPKVLPKGVYFIVSQRPVAVRLQVDIARTPRCIVRFSEYEDKNLEDMNVFLKEASKWPNIAEVLTKSDITSDQFVKALMDKCKGFWIYLNFIIYEIEHGKRTPLDLDELPVGLSQYYASYWLQLRDNNEIAWYDTYLPTLTTLAKIRESVTIETLINLAGIDVELSHLRRIIKEDWRPFLTVSSEEKEHIRFYHATLQDFFEGIVDEENFTSAEWSFIEELRGATSGVDNRIAKYYLKAWGGLDGGLSELNDPSKQEIDEGYGLHHLSYHMFHRILNAVESIDLCLEKIDEFLYLISNPTWWQARRRSDPAGSGLADDFGLAVLGASCGQIATLPHYICASYLEARLTSQISNLPSEIFGAYAILGLSNQAIDLAYSLAKAEQRASAFFLLATWYIRQGDPENANHLLELVETNLREITKNDAKPKNWADIARLYFQIGKEEKFKSCLKEAYDLINDEQEESKRHNMIVIFLKSLNGLDTNQLQPILEKIKNFVEDVHVSKYHARIIMMLAEEFYSIDKAISLDLANRAIIESSPSRIELEIVDSERLFARRNAFLSENSGILFKIGFQEQALEMMKTINKKDQLIDALANLANFLISNNRSSEARKYIYQAEEISKDLDGVSQNQIKILIIDLLLKINDLSMKKF